MLQLEHSEILLTFFKLPSVIKISVLSILERPLKTGFTVANFNIDAFQFWQFKQKAGQSFQELKPLANYRLEFL